MLHRQSPMIYHVYVRACSSRQRTRGRVPTTESGVKSMKSMCPRRLDGPREATYKNEERAIIPKAWMTSYSYIISPHYTALGTLSISC